MPADNYTCPTCGNDFDGRRGLGVHNVHAHDERLPNRTCAECEEESYSDSSKKYGSEECLETAAPSAGEDNPTYRGGKDSPECELCGAPLKYYPSEKKGLYCSDCVENETWQEPPGVSGPDHPRWTGGFVTVECAICEETTERRPGTMLGEAVLCRFGEADTNPTATVSPASYRTGRRQPAYFVRLVGCASRSPPT